MDQDRVPHVVILPLPLSGHVKPMLTVAELLCNAGFLITFVNSDYNHDRLERVMDIPTFYNRSPGFRFVSISDGLPLDQPRLGPIIFQLFFNTTMVSKPLFWELLISLRQSTERSPPTCIIADGLMCFAIHVAEEIGVPIITFPTHGSHGMWTIMHTSNLIEEGEVPFQGKWTWGFLTLFATYTTTELLLNQVGFCPQPCSLFVGRGFKHLLSSRISSPGSKDYSSSSPIFCLLNIFYSYLKNK